MYRNDLQVLARIRPKEAETLVAARMYDGAYYLAGYAVECALKACIAKATKRHEFPDLDRVRECHTHKVATLVKQAGLEGDFRRERTKDAEFDKNWTVVQSWSEQSRYKRMDALEAENMLTAVGDRRHGILAWLKRYW